MASAVVPAAGAAARFGGGKLFALVEGVPMLDRTLGALLDASIEDVVVVLPPGADWTGRIKLLADSRVRRVENPDPSRGMFSSIQTGVRAAGAAPVAVLPGDMPFVRTDTIKRLLDQATGGGIVSPRLAGRRGHPVIIPADVCEAIVAAPVTAVLNEVLRPYAARFVNLDVSDTGVVHDVDVAEDLGR
jgi:molybdenum cofactor cytidylyltransferase